MDGRNVGLLLDYCTSLFVMINMDVENRGLDDWFCSYHSSFVILHLIGMQWGMISCTLGQLYPSVHFTRTSACRYIHTHIPGCPSVFVLCILMLECGNRTTTTDTPETQKPHLAKTLLMSCVYLQPREPFWLQTDKLNWTLVGTWVAHFHCLHPLSNCPNNNKYLVVLPLKRTKFSYSSTVCHKKFEYCYIPTFFRSCYRG